MVQKTDPLTGEKFNPKRIDQKFATPQNRKRYYNALLTQQRREDAEYELPIKVNKWILTALMEGKEAATFHKEYLLGKGFTFHAMNNYINYEGKTRNAVYKFIVLNLGNDQIKIVKDE